MRAILFAVYILFVYYAIRAVIHWLRQSPPRPGAAPGEMVIDPECRVYVLRERAVTRHIRGRILCFCSEDCAATHAARKRG